MKQQQKQLSEEKNVNFGKVTQENADLIAQALSWPFLKQASGLYEWKMTGKLPVSTGAPVPYSSQHPPIDAGDDVNGREPQQEEEIDLETDEETASTLLPILFKREELRLDVDGRYPQMTASGSMYSGMALSMHWIASLKTTGRSLWAGDIWYKSGTAAFPYTKIKIKAITSLFSSQRKAVVVFYGGGGKARKLIYRFKSSYYHPVEFEYDAVEGAPLVTSIDTTAHPNHPASVPAEILTIENVFRRAGFDVRKSTGDQVISNDSGPDALWSDMEMHDAMQIYWSRFADTAQWSMWVLFASLHEMGTGLGGIMFDDIGPNHRQGTAIFGNSFIATPPTGDPAPDAWVNRMRFWTACHEMGHAFNLAHSWQKELGIPWITLVNEDEARSFMNYPYRVTGGESAFFSDFEYRFSDSELLFMRHAPERFVQMGNADWFDHHGFQQANRLQNSTFRLEIRVNRERPVFEFMEPVMLELKLTNLTREFQLVDPEILKPSHDLTVILKKKGSPARQWAPYARCCTAASRVIVDSGKSLYHSVLISAGLNGWDIAEPGEYLIQVALKHGEEDIISNPLTIRVAPSRGYDEEAIAQDFFSEDIGRVLCFNGTRFLSKANDTLREIAERLPEKRVAFHAKLALSNPSTRRYKLLNMNGEKRFQTLDKDMGMVKSLLDEALFHDPQRSAETLGHIYYKKSVDKYSRTLFEEGEFESAARSQEDMLAVLQSRGVVESVLKQVEITRTNYLERTNPASATM